MPKEGMLGEDNREEDEDDRPDNAEQYWNATTTGVLKEWSGLFWTNYDLN